MAAHGTAQDARRPRVIERLAAWTAGRPDPAELGRRSGALADCEDVGFDTTAGRAPRGVGASVAGRRGEHRGEPRGPAGRPLRRLPPPVGCARAGRGGGRRPRPDRAGLRRPRVLGRRRVRPPRPGRHPARRRPGPCSNTASAGFPSPAPPLPPEGCGAPASRGSPPSDGSDVTPPHVRGPRGQLIPIETGRHEVHIVADVAWAAARVRGVDRRHRLPGRPGPGPARRHGPLLGQPRPARPRWARPPLRRDGPRRIPPGGRRQRLHQRHGPLEPPPGGRAGRRTTGGDARRGERLAATWLRHWSTARTRDAGSTSSSPATGTSSRCSSPSRPAAGRRRHAAGRRTGRRLAADQAGRRADAPPPRPRRGRARVARARTSPTTSRGPPTAAHCRRPSTPRCWPGPVNPTGRWRCFASPPASISTT